MSYSGVTIFERSGFLISAGCINLGWSVSKTVHYRVLDLPGDKKT